jgi:hypothetical protein
MPVVVIPSKPAVPVEVPTVAPEPQEHKCTGVFDHEIGQWTCGSSEHHPGSPEPVVVAEPVPEPVVVAEPEPAVIELPVAPEPEPVVVAASEVEAPAEVTEAPAEAGLVPENPPTE